MRWLIGLTIALLLGTIAATTVGALLEDDVAQAPVSSGPAASRPGSTSPGETPTSGTIGGVSSPTDGSTTFGPTPPTTTGGPGAPTFTASEVSVHATSADCWLIISGHVYDVTTYLSDHPGGAPTITPWCGKESTEAFTTEDGEGEHSAKAWGLLEDYRVGELTG